MGFFDSLQKPGFKAAKGQQSQIQQEITRTPTPPRTSIPLAQRLNNRPLLRKQFPKQKRTGTKTSPKPHAPITRKRASATPQRLESDSDDDGVEVDSESATKRVRRHGSIELDVDRQIRSSKAFSTAGDVSFSMAHAADIASLSNPTKFTSAFPNDPQAVEVYLQYPSASQREKYAPSDKTSNHLLTKAGTILPYPSKMTTSRH